jgi:hypothetical protein
MLYNGNLLKIDTSLIICDGNSITAGGQYGGTPYPAHLKNLPVFNSVGCVVVNAGVGGQTTQQMTDDAVNQIDSQFTTSRLCVVVAMEMSNDLYFNRDVAGACSRFKTYCLSRRNAGFKVVTVSICDRYVPDYGDVQGFRNMIAACNTWLRNDWQSFANSYVDAMSVPELANADNLVNFPDRTHPASEPLRLLAVRVGKAIERLK